MGFLYSGKPPICGGMISGALVSAEVKTKPEASTLHVKHPPFGKRRKMLAWVCSDGRTA